MSATLGPSWSLRSNAPPRCLTAHVVSEGAIGHGASAASVDSSNPFDDRSSSLPGYSGNDSANNGECVYSVVFGTERGSLHSRTYPATAASPDAAEGYGAVGHHRQGGGYHHHDRGPGRVDPSQLMVEPEPGAGDGGGPINLQGAVKGSIVGIVRAIAAAPSAPQYAHRPPTATPVLLLLVDDNRGSSSAAQSSNPGAYAAHLVTINRGAFGKLAAAPAAADGGSHSIAADQRPSAAAATSQRWSSASVASGASVSSGSWHSGDAGVGRHVPGGGAQQFASLAGSSGGGGATSSPSLSVGPLPRMSCATYHPRAGYIYAAGTGVYSLPGAAVEAVTAAVATAAAHSTPEGGGPGASQPPSSPAGGPRGGPLHPSRPPRRSPATPAARAPHLSPAAVYPRCGRALPLPGVRCSASGAAGHALALACEGRVAVAAVGNAFYAVPACVDVRALRRHHLAEAGVEANGPGAGPPPGPAGVGGRPAPTNVTAIKIATFAQSSQVHPVIAIEVSSGLPSLPDPGTAPPPSGLDLLRYVRPVTALVFLASGRECTTLLVSSVPDPGPVGALGQDAAGQVGGGLVSTLIEVGAPKHGKFNASTTLPSPILAAASLPPSGTDGGGGGDLSAGPLVALLTADGLVHLRAPSCVAVPLASIEVGTRPNDFFSLSALSLPATRTARPRAVAAASYGGEARLVAIPARESPIVSDQVFNFGLECQ